MSSNLLKRGTTNIQQDDTRVIAVNELMLKRIEALGIKAQHVDVNDGFVSGLAAVTIESDGMTEGDMTDALFQSNVIKADAEPVFSSEEAEAEAENIIAEATRKADEILQEAKTQAEIERQEMLEQARSRGYAEGKAQAERELAELAAKYAERQEQLEAEYQQMVDDFEPQFVDTITGIYEHIFHVELGSYREILCHLISTTMRKTEGKREFIIHVSKDDYPYVSGQKEQITTGGISSNSLVEIIEDMNLATNECFIETEGGVFECGLETQLTELRQMLRLLSYEK